MAFTKAERTNLYLRCALFGPSGSGKTMTALRMAKGIADKMGVPFAVIDTEARSASKYADRFAFTVDNLEKKTVDDYIASMNECVRLGFKVLVIDSLTHAWRELTEEVDRIAEKSTSKNSFSPWAKVNPKQKRFIEAILNFPGHIIATMRSNTEWVVGDKNGKSVPEKVGLKPEQGKGIEFEFDLLVELDQKHQAVVTKDRTGKFQDEAIDKPGEAFGADLYDWLSAGTAPVPQAPQSPKKVTANGKAETAKPLPGLKEQGNQIIKEIGAIITAEAGTGACFSEEEKEGARQLVKSVRLDEAGIKELNDFKDFLTEELAKRRAKPVKPGQDAA
ncbi:MAG: ATP-binding protein [Treponema sp.]|jgi:hypothetical protein|nr:ATP-binding protein [Treponema sp.]